MGTLLGTYLLPKSDPGDDTPDTELGLTKREKDAVRQTMEPIRKDVKNIGSDLFVRFFTVYPNYQKFFRAFADVPLSELKKNKKLGAHATAVVYSLSSLVENLDDPENVTELMVKICEGHLPREVSRTQFEHLGEVLISFLEDALGKLMTPNAKSGWTKLFALLASIADEVADEKRK